MRRACLLVCLLLPLPPALAEPANLAQIAPGLLCRSAITAAERGNGIPAHLLAAIGRVESGRRDPVSGAWHPWPWTVNAEGQGSFYDSKAQAIAAVRDMQAHGIRSIDVGCAQVNLMHHPDAFPSLEVAFDPQANAAYAGHFLADLHAQAGDWNKAAGFYHSQTPDLAAEYQRRVLAVWPEESRLAGTGTMSQLAQAWGATLSTAPLGFARVIRQDQPGRFAAAQPIPLPAGAPPGRSLADYRAMPVALAFRPPARRGG